MISFLLYLVIALVVLGLVFWLLQYLPIPQPFLNIIRVVLILILIIWLLFYLVPGFPHGHLVTP